MFTQHTAYVLFMLCILWIDVYTNCLTTVGFTELAPKQLSFSEDPLIASC